MQPTQGGPNRTDTPCPAGAGLRPGLVLLAPGAPGRRSGLLLGPTAHAPAAATVVVGVWLRDVLGTLDHEHRVREGARIERRAVAGVGEAPLLPQTLSDDHLGRAPAQHALAAGVVGLVEAGEQPLQVAVAGDGDPEHLSLHAPVEALHRPVRARRAGLGLAVLDAELAAALLEAVGREAGAAVGQQVRDPEREGRER